MREKSPSCANCIRGSRRRVGLPLLGAGILFLAAVNCRPARAEFGTEIRVTDGTGSATQTATGLDIANNAYIASIVSEKLRIRIIGPELDVDVPIVGSGLGQGDPDFATNSRGVTYMAFTQMEEGSVGEGREIYLTKNEGGWSTEPVRITDNRVDDFAPDLVLDTNGEPRLIWARRVGDDTQVIYLPDCLKPIEETTVGEGDYPVTYLDRGGIVHVAYIRDNDIYYRNNRGGQFGPESLITTTPFEPESSVSIGGDPDGNLLVSYESKNSLYFAFQRPQSGFEPPRLVDRGGVLDPKMRVRRDGKVTIVYAKAGDIFFVQGHSTVLNLPQRIAESPEVESHPSLEVDVANNIHVSYVRGGDVYYKNNASKPTADFSALPTTGEVPLAVRFADLSSGGVKLWKWDFGDGTQSSVRNPEHTYTKPAKYKVTLEVTAPGATYDKKEREDYIFVQDPENTLRIPDQRVYPNQRDVWFPVIAGHIEPIQAFQLMGTYDPNILELRKPNAYELAYTSSQPLVPEVLDFNDRGGFFEVGCIFDFFPPHDGRELVGGAEQTILQLVFDVSQGAPQGVTTQVRLENNAELSRIFNIFTVGGFTRIPALTASTVTILRVEPPFETFFLRGDVDQSGLVDITDPILVLNYLFLGGDTPTCLDAADVNDTGKVDISGAILLLNFLFLGGQPPAVPFPTAGLDPTPDPLAACE